MLMCSCGSESNNIGDSELKAETIADNEVAKSEIITKEIAEESIKSIISEESDKSDFVISKNILISYKGCDSHVIIPDGVKKIADGAFWSVDYIEAVEIPGSVEEIGNGAFWSCAGLKYINVAEGLKTIGDTAFWSCPSLKDVNLPNSVSKIYDASFANCSEVTIHAPEGPMQKNMLITDDCLPIIYLQSIMTAVMKMLLELHNINMKNLQSLRLQMILLQLKQMLFNTVNLLNL